jgi:hypothetical protein
MSEPVIDLSCKQPQEAIMHNTIVDHLQKSAGQISAQFNALHDITLQIGAFHMARAEIYQNACEKMAGATDVQTLLALQQDFIHSSLDNLMDHSRAMAGLLTQTASLERADESGN